MYINLARKLTKGQLQKKFGLNKYFIIPEFVPPEIFDKFGVNSLRFIDPRLITIAVFVREKTGLSVTINDWFWGGQFQNSGYRTPECSEGADLSAHKRSVAVDLKIKNWGKKEWKVFVKENKRELIKLGATAIEDLDYTENWLHITTECFIEYVGKLLVYKP